MDHQPKGVPADDFYVVRDVERNIIVTTGRQSEARDRAKAFNEIYQSTAYRAEPWRPHN